MADNSITAFNILFQVRRREPPRSTSGSRSARSSPSSAACTSPLDVRATLPYYRRSLDININLWWGVAMGVFRSSPPDSTSPRRPVGAPRSGQESDPGGRWTNGGTASGDDHTRWTIRVSGRSDHPVGDRIAVDVRCGRHRVRDHAQAALGGTTIGGGTPGDVARGVRSPGSRLRLGDRVATGFGAGRRRRSSAAWAGRLRLDDGPR